MNMVDDVRGVGVIKMMMVDDVGEGGVENDQKSDDIICGRPLSYMSQMTSYKVISVPYFFFQTKNS